MTARFGETDPGLPIEQFIQALTSQLDRAQSALALKARAGLPLTFALKDLTLDLRTHVEMAGSVVRIRPAGPGETEASMLHVSLTTITKPMIEENTAKLALATEEPALRDVVGDQLNDDELRRLEWAGVHTVSQFVDLQEHTNADALERVAQVPAMRLRAALDRASRPRIGSVTTFVPRPSADPGRPASTDGGLFPEIRQPFADTPLIRVKGINLVRGNLPTVRIGGEKVPVLQAGKRELVLAPLAHQMSGTLEIETAPGMVVTEELPAAGAT